MDRIARQGACPPTFHRTRAAGADNSSREFTQQEAKGGKQENHGTARKVQCKGSIFERSPFRQYRLAKQSNYWVKDTFWIIHGNTGSYLL
jgi:hypothetical protein